MIRTLRPPSGQLDFFIAVLFFIAGGLSGCAPKEGPDNWQLSPPILKTSDPKGLLIEIRAGDLKKSSPANRTVLGPSTSLSFEESDRGFPLSVTSECHHAKVDATQTVPPSIEHTALSQTSDLVSMLDIVPPQILSPKGLALDWVCDFKVAVTNPRGTVSGGRLLGLKINNASLIEKLNSNSIVIPQSLPQGKYLLACPTWWVQSPDNDLEKASVASSVNGLDSRGLDRRPLCTVFSSPRSIVGVFRPAYQPPKLSWSTESLVPRTDGKNIFHRPLLAWTIRNQENFPVVAFLPLAEAGVRLSSLGLWQGPPQWFKSLRADPLITASGFDSRTTAKGFYVRLQPHAEARLVMNSNREPGFVALTDFVPPQGSTHLMIAATSPLRLSTLANEREAGNLAAADQANLDALPRDIFNAATPPLLGCEVLSRESGGPLLTLTGLTCAAARSMGPIVHSGGQPVGGALRFVNGALLDEPQD